jgi:uncharacterized membrane protein
MTHEHHIRNPLEWAWAQMAGAGHALGSAAHAIHGDTRSHPVVRRIGVADIRAALAEGLRDFAAFRTDVIFICLIYPLAGLALARLAFGYDLIPLIFPLASGFALLGPAAAIGLYEMSRRREQGADVTWADAFGVVRSPAFAALMVLSLVLLVIFAAWVAVAYVIYAVTLGTAAPASMQAFAEAVFTTPAGWTLIGLGVGAGFLFAVGVLAVSVVSFPLLVDRDTGLLTAVATSVRAVRANPGPMALWGMLVAAGLVIGSLPALVGLVIVMPVLGHATWHLYRRLIG